MTAILSALALSLLAITSAQPAAAYTCPVVTADGTVVPAPFGTTNWMSCNLSGAHLDGMDLRQVVLGSTNLSAASMAGVNLVGVNVAGTNFTGANLHGADFTGDYADHTIFAGADLSGSVLAGLHGSTINLTAANLTGATMGGIRASSVVGEPALAPPGWKVVSGVLAGPGADLSRRVLNSVSLAGLDLSGASLLGADLYGSNLTNVALGGSDIRGTRFDNVDLTGASGLATAWANQTTTWMGATCPDAKVADKHDGDSCQGALDTTAPVLRLAAPSFAFVSTYAPTLALTVAEKGSGLDTYRIRTASGASGRIGLSAWTTTIWYSGDPNPFYPPFDVGRRTCVQVQGRDRAGNTGPWSAVRCADTVYDETGSGWYRAGSWWFTARADSFAASLETTRRHGDEFLSDKVLTVHRLGVLATTCPTCGAVTFYVGRAKVGTISLARPTTTYGRLLVLPPLARRLVGTVRLVVSSPTGRMVRLDGLAVSAY